MRAYRRTDFLEQRAKLAKTLGRPFDRRRWASGDIGGGEMSKKREANAGKRRKSRAPVVTRDGLKQQKEVISDRELWQLNNRLEELERLRKAEVLNTPFIALEALGALSGRLGRWTD